MNAHSQSTHRQRILTLGLVALGVLFAGFFLSSEQAQAAPPIKISTDSSHTSGVQAVTNTTPDVTEDIYIYMEDDPSITEVWWRKGHNIKSIDTVPASGAYDFSYDLDSIPTEKVEFELERFSGLRTITAYTKGSSEEIVIGTYNIPYAEEYLGYTYNDYDIRAVAAYSDLYVIGGVDDSGGNPDWRLVRQKVTQPVANSVWNTSFQIGPGRDELYDIADNSFGYKVVAVGAYENSGGLYPATAIRDWFTGADEAKNIEVWGSGVEGAVYSVVVGLDDLNDSAVDRNNVDTTAWYVGYKEHPVDGPVWAIGTMDAKDGTIDPSFGGGSNIKGEAKVITKDLDYIYVGGYTDDGGNNIWRIEKRNRSNGALITAIDTTLGVEGEVLALEPEISNGNGINALWAAGYEQVGSNMQWRFQRFTFNGGGDFVPGVSGGSANDGAIKEIDFAGGNYIYFGGHTDAANPRMLVEAYGLDGVQKGGGEGVLLSKNLGGGSGNEFGAMELPIVVGYNNDVGSGLVQGVTFASPEPTCLEAGYDPAVTTQEERFVIDYKNRRAPYCKDGDDSNDPLVGCVDVLEPYSLPAGKYDVFQVGADIHHKRYLTRIEQTQERESFVTYLLGSNPGEFVATDASADVPSDADWFASSQLGLTIPFGVASTTLAHYLHDVDDGGTDASNWNNKGVINDAGSSWKSGGSLEAVCTVLDRYPQCNDGIDNDGDGLADRDGVDFNSDGLYTLPGEYPPDPGCTSLDDDDEDGVPQCNDGIDNDGDGATDGADPECDDLTDNYEGSCSLTAPVGGYLVDFGSGTDHVRSNKTLDTARLTPPIAISMVPRNYIVEVEAVDPDHPLGAQQDHEQWRIQLLDGPDPNTASVLDETETTDDLPNLDTTQIEEVNSVSNPVTITSAVTHVMAVHGQYPDVTSPESQATANSIHPLCATFEPVGLPDLIEPFVYDDEGDGQILIPSSTWNPETGFYTDVKIKYAVKNDGVGDTTVPSFDNSFVSDFRVNPPHDSFSSINGAPASTVATISGILGAGDTSSPRDTVTIASDVPPGDYQVIITADSADDELEEDEAFGLPINNVRTIVGSLLPMADSDPLPAPDPSVSLSVSPDFVRYGEEANLVWSMEACYEMECKIHGPSGELYTFDPSTYSCDASDPTISDSVTAPSITTKTEFLLECTENISGHNDTFSATAVVETTGRVEER